MCLEVRRRNCGIDGRPILFYAPRHSAPVAKRKPKQKRTPTTRYPEVIDGVRALGLTTVTATEVDAVVNQLFPSGTDGVDPGEVIRQVFLSIRRQDRPDNVSW